MKKSIHENVAYYTIAWSRDIQYDKYSASRILPELPGILCLFEPTRPEPTYLLFYSCWRDGLRLGIKNLFDPVFSRHIDIVRAIEKKNIYYKYAIIDTTPLDLKDILYWLISRYEPEFNSIDSFTDSGRYENISLREMVMRPDQILPQLPKSGL